MKALLVTHIEPVIHGQAKMASVLVEQARSWDGVELLSLNTVYSTDRADLGSGSLKKILKLRSYTNEVVRMIREESVEVVILTPAFFVGPFLKDAWMISAIKAKTRAKIVGWVHMDPSRLNFESKGAIFQSIVRKTIDKVDLWVSCAESLHEMWPSFITGEKRAVANGIASSSMVPSTQTGDRVRVLYLSAMDTMKGWKDLFSVALKICKNHTDVEFVFYGGAADESEQEVSEVFRRSGYSDRILWRGEVSGPEKKKAFEGADVFVMPSYSEQFSLAVLEAMSFGLPVVATDVGAVGEALPDQKLVKPGDTEELMQQIEKVITDVDLRKSTGSVNQQRFQKLFTEEQFGACWKELLKSMNFFG